MSFPFQESPPQGSPEWVALKRTCIGSSDAAAACGLAPSTWEGATPVGVYLDKRGEAPPVTVTMAMRKGTALEPVIITDYEEQQGVHVLRSPPMVRHAEHSWMGASFDGIVCPEDCTTLEEAIASGYPLRLVEAKTVDFFVSHQWGEPGTDQAPDYYLIQVQHALEVLHSICPHADPVAHLVPLFDRDPHAEVYPVQRNQDVAQSIIRIERELWRKIEAGTPPAPSTGADVELLVKKSSPVKVVASSEQFETWRELVEVRAASKSLAGREIELKDKLKLAMVVLDDEGNIRESADTLVDDAGRELVTWRTSKPTERLDQKALKAAHPEIAKEFTVEGKASRPFNVKDPKEK